MDTAVLIVCVTPIVCVLFVGTLMILPVIITEIRDCLEARARHSRTAVEISEVRACIRKMTTLTESNNITWSPNRALVELANTLFANPIIFGRLTNDDKNMIYESINVNDTNMAIVKFVGCIADILERIEAN